mgnify:CR=1 FL=1
MKILEHFTKDELLDLLNSSTSFRDFLLKIGSSSNGTGAYKSIKKQLIEIGITNFPKFNYSNFFIQISKKKSNNEVFIENSSYTRSSLKKRIIKYNLIEYKCSKCNNDGFWNGEKLTLQLEHKNGINDDNRLENLEFLCPNCHSQTSTYCSKNRKHNTKKEYFCKCGNKILKYSYMCTKCTSKEQRKISRPNKEQLNKEINELGYCGVGRKYGVSDNAIRKWKKYYEKTI